MVGYFPYPGMLMDYATAHAESSFGSFLPHFFVNDRWPPLPSLATKAKK
jgi:hypothetical protein